MTVHGDEPPRDVPRRVVTGHAMDGRSVFVSDAPTPTSRVVAGGAVFHELWNTEGTPAPIVAEEDEPTRRHALVPPPPRGSIIRIVDLPPGGSSPMHRTETIDYGVVLSGEVHLVLDDEETLLHAGDVVVQRGTDHLWANRGAGPARMLFVLLEGTFADELLEILPDGATERLMSDAPQPD